MKELEIIKKLAEIAREEPAPFVNVTGLVVRNLIMRKEPVISFWWLAAVSAATIVSFVLFMEICLAPQDPLTAFFESIRSVLL